MEQKLVTLESFIESLNYAEDLISEINNSPYCELSENLHILESYKVSLYMDYDNLKSQKIDTKSIDAKYGEVMDSICYYINAITQGC